MSRTTLRRLPSGRRRRAYLTVSLQATAISFALAGTLASDSRTDPAVVGSIAHLPLVIILPAWWVIFDKAASITRMASYLRISERAIGGESIPFIGWERAVERFRQDYAARRRERTTPARSSFRRCGNPNR